MINVFDQYKRILLDIHAEWKKSEACVKEAEQVNGTVIFPAIKELRYAGRRVIDAIYLICIDGNPELIFEYLMDAKFDANRARHDAVDAVVSKVAIETENILKSYDYSTIMQTFPRIQEYISTIISVQQEIVNSRGSVEDRNNIYDKIEQSHYPVMLSYYRELIQNEMGLKKLAQERKEADALRVRWAYGAGIIGILVGLAAALTTFFH